MDRMNSPKFLVHLTAFGIDGWTTGYYFLHVPGGDKMGGHFGYLTVWNILFQTLYFFICLVTDVMGPIDEPSPNNNNDAPADDRRRGGSRSLSLKTLRDAVHACVVFPKTVFVFVMFWTLYNIDRELVHPKEADIVIPAWLNHLLHTSILPLVLADKWVTHVRYPHWLLGLAGTSIFVSLYLVWILAIAYLDSFWVYPILEVLTMIPRVAFFALCFVLFCAFYFIGERITFYIWASEGDETHSD